MALASSSVVPAHLQHAVWAEEVAALQRRISTLQAQLERAQRERDEAHAQASHMARAVATASASIRVANETPARSPPPQDQPRQPKAQLYATGTQTFEREPVEVKRARDVLLERLQERNEELEAENARLRIVVNGLTSERESAHAVGRAQLLSSPSATPGGRLGVGPSSPGGGAEQQQQHTWTPHRLQLVSAHAGSYSATRRIAQDAAAAAVESVTWPNQPPPPPPSSASRTPLAHSGGGRVVQPS